MAVPVYLQTVSVRRDIELDGATFPTSLPFVRGLNLTFDDPVTFFVGENGSGKSTLLEAIAELCGLPVGGGGRNELGDLRVPHTRSELSPSIRAGFRRRPRDGDFFRAEFQAHFASLLEQRHDDPDLRRNPYARYGGRSLHTLSHGEAFLAMFRSWMTPGIILMDEPEAALSPQRQLALLVQMAKLSHTADVQFIIATHSPILLTFPGAALFSFDGGAIEKIAFRDTAHYQITRGILEDPERYWHHLLRDLEEPG